MMSMVSQKVQKMLDNPPGFLWFPPEYLKQNTKRAEFLRKCRRFWLSLFHRDYVDASSKYKREGDCNRCGACCSLVYTCPFLGRDKDDLPYCRVYGDLRPMNCKTYPFDYVDSEIEICSYTFKK